MIAPRPIHRRKSPRSGFTLLEVLIALGIVSIIALLSWRGLEEVIRSALRVNQVDQRTQTTTALFSQLEQDLADVYLTTGNPNITDERNAISLADTGLQINLIRRPEGRAAFEEIIEWSLEAGQLLRVTRSGVALEVVSRSEPIPIKGLAVRLFREPEGWSAASSVGTPSPLPESAFPVLAGNPNRLDLSNAPPTQAPGGGGGGSGGTGSGAVEEAPTPGEATGLIRAVEVSVTLENNQSYRRLFLTGGLY